MWALRHWRHITQGSTTIAITDHSATCSLQNPSKVFKNRRMANYAAELGDMDVILAHRSGRVHHCPDWLSRCVHEEDEETLKDLYSKLSGDVAKVAVRVGLRKQQILFSTETQHKRLHHAIKTAAIFDEQKRDGTPIRSVHDFVAAVSNDDRHEQQNKRQGEVHEPTRLSEYYDMITPVGAENCEARWDIDRVVKSQANDKFSSCMKHYLEKGTLPAEIKQWLIDDDSLLTAMKKKRHQ